MKNLFKKIKDTIQFFWFDNRESITAFVAGVIFDLLAAGWIWLLWNLAFYEKFPLEYTQSLVLLVLYQSITSLPKNNNNK